MSRRDIEILRNLGCLTDDRTLARGDGRQKTCLLSVYFSLSEDLGYAGDVFQDALACAFADFDLVYCFGEGRIIAGSAAIDFVVWAWVYFGRDGSWS